MSHILRDISGECCSCQNKKLDRNSRLEIASRDRIPDWAQYMCDDFLLSLIELYEKLRCIHYQKVAVTIVFFPE